jgi:hypothetical protein
MRRVCIVLLALMLLLCTGVVASAEATNNEFYNPPVMGFF